MSGGIEALPLLALSIIMEIEEAERALSLERRKVRVATAEEVRNEQLRGVRGRFLLELRDVYMALHQCDALLPAHAERLRQQVEAIQAALEAAQSEREMWRIAQATPRLLADLRQALAVKQRSDQSATFEAQRQETEQRLREELRAREREAAKQCAINEFQALLAGLKADPVVMRWHNLAVSNLELFADQIALSEHPNDVLNAANERANVLIEEANKAEVKAKQRDYVVSGISRSLTEMGFVVSDPKEEHPDHPATAKLLHAASPAGKEIAISVPVEGQVWYEVDGYHQETTSAVGGGTAVVCDEAEGVLNEMHALLDAEFQVQMGEITWRGKDPNRVLRKADQLPSSVPTQRGRGR